MLLGAGMVLGFIHKDRATSARQQMQQAICLAKLVPA